MTRGEAIPPDVKQFLADHIRSVEQLEILLLLRQQPDRTWPIAELAQAMYGPEDSAARQLGRLVASGLVARDGEAATFRYAPLSPNLAATIDRLAHTYSERRVAVLTSLAEGPMENVHAFSAAFRLRKEDRR